MCESTGVVGGGASAIGKMGLEFLEARWTQGPAIAVDDGDGDLKYGGPIKGDGVGLLVLVAVGDGWSCSIEYVVEEPNESAFRCRDGIWERCGSSCSGPLWLLVTLGALSIFALLSSAFFKLKACRYSLYSR